MQLTRFTDYSLRTLIYLGAHPDRLCTIAEIAEAYAVSVNHLMKVVNRLSTSGHVEAVRGKGGGLRLARAPRLISIGEVVRAMEERFEIVECLNAEHQTCPLLPGCALKVMLVDAQRQFLAALDGRTLQDVLGADAGGRFAALRGKRAAARRPREAGTAERARVVLRIASADRGSKKPLAAPRRK